jgi:hypothetical protein
MKQKKPRKPRKKQTYSKGEKNKIVDSLLHPFYRRSQLIRVVDGVIHGLIEQDTKSSAKKFVRYNLPEFLKEVLKEL